MNEFLDRKRTKTWRKNLNLTSNIVNYNYYSCPSDTIKYSLESSKFLSFRHVLIVQLRKFIWWIHSSDLSWLCAVFYLTQKYWDFFFNFVTTSVVCYFLTLYCLWLGCTLLPPSIIYPSTHHSIKTRNFLKNKLLFQ